jgi:PAS domain S-box-containing protein
MTAEDRYHQLFEASPGAILTVDREGHIGDCNRAACQLLGRARSELLGTPVLRWVVPSDRPRCKSYFIQALRGGTLEWTIGIARGDGTTRAVSLRATMPVHADGDVPLTVFLQEVALDRPGRPEAAQLQNILENLPGQFVVVIDPAGRIRYASGLARTLWYDDEARLGREFETLLEADGDSQTLLEGMRRETSEGRQWDGLLWFVRADGSSIPVRIFAVPYRDPRKNTIIGTLLVGRDITREHEAEAAVAKAQRHARIGELVVSIGQELRKPISRIDALAVRLRERLGPGEVDPAAPESELSTEIARLDRMVDALLAFARDTGVERSSVDVVALLSEIVAEQRYGIGEDRIRIIATIPPDLPRVVLDAGQVRQALRAVLTNAREALAGRPGGQIRVDATATPVGIVIRIADNGPPIRAEWLEQAFEPFFTTKLNHLGLGLAIARGIIAAHDGRIWAERDGDGWTCVTIELPLEPPASTIAFRPIPLVLCRARSVLVVDDDASVRSVTRKFLEKVGYKVLEAWSGRSALAQITSGQPPELVITDLKMKDGTGYWFLEQLARDFPNLLRHTVIMTGDSSHAAVEKLARETGCPVVRKPFELNHLLEALDEAALRS